MRHPHGTFSWMDIALPDPDRGKAFYSAMFGWEWTDVPAPHNMTWTIFNQDGKSVAGLWAEQPGMRPEGVPPYWNSYIATTDLDATAERAKGLGATILLPPMDLMEAGRMAMAQDPGGATFFLWQAGQHGGSEVMHSPGAMTWNEFYTRDLEATQSFYSGLFGWEWMTMPMPQDGAYHVAHLGGANVGGTLVIDENWGDVPSHWMVYIQVEDADDAAAKVTSLGGDICVPVTKIPVGRFAVVNDDQKGTFTIFEPSE